MKSPFVICGATGNVGSKLARSLLAAGNPVRAIGRERIRLGPLAAAGAEAWPGDLGDGKFLSNAFSGARAVFAMIPPKYDAPDMVEYQNDIGEAVVSALARSRVPRVITLSNVGAHLSEGSGPIRGLHDFEKKFGRLGDAGVVHLRAAYFMENPGTGRIELNANDPGRVRANRLRPVVPGGGVTSRTGFCVPFADFVPPPVIYGRKPPEINQGDGRIGRDSATGKSPGEHQASYNH